MRVNNLKNTKIPEIIDGSLQEKFNYYFDYQDGDLIIKNKWALPCQIGKIVGNRILFNHKEFKKEDIIWIMYNGDIEFGMSIVRINPAEKCKIENLKKVDYKYITGRPKTSLDKNKRKRKKFLTAKEERYIKENWLNNSIGFFADKYGVSHKTIKNVGKTLNLPSKITISHFLKKCEKIDDLKDKCGIYAICTSDHKIYIGSSANIYKRIYAHLNKLNNNIHWNKSLQNSWNEKSWYGIVEECSEERLIERENYYIKHTANVHNFWTHFEMSKEDIDFLKEKILKQITIDENNCWNYKGCITKSGYGEIYMRKSKKKRFIHRIMYFAHNHIENQNTIIRHKCGNKKCCNPNHLESGSYRDNGLDIKREEMDLFEKRFVETNYNSKVLTEEFSIDFKTVYSRVTSRELCKKYPEVRANKYRIQMSEI